MPTYEYECTKCNHAFEEEAPITAPPRQRCPRCRGKVQRLISGGSGIVFRGAGFYINDSRPKREPAKPETAASAPAKPATPSASAAPAHDSKSPTSDKPKS
jgi:putative FmdB family regulatory protein